MIVSKKLSPESFPKLFVVRYQGTLWSLDNRRLWVFRKAHVVRITVLVYPDFESHPRIVNLKSDRSLMAQWSCESYFPRVRGNVRQYLDQQELKLPAAVPTGFLDPENGRRLTPASTSLRSPVAACSRASHTVIDIDERRRTPSSFRQVTLHAEIATQIVDSEQAVDGGMLADRQQLPCRCRQCFPGTDAVPDSERHGKKVRNGSLDDIFLAFQRPCQVAPTTLAADELIEAIKEPRFHSTAAPPAASPPRHVCLEVATFNVHSAAPFEHESMRSKATVQDTNYTGAATPEGTEIPKLGAEGQIPSPDAEEDHIPNAGTEVGCGKLYRFFYWLISFCFKDLWN
ncbi:unnamed protein product [Sphagnum jensenii]|uniref:Uncharacterized protein n=1 Tax=Sphagnum jensenii TaxID=128206 RepID=A0ABP0XEX8_9BRYO